MKLGDKVRCRTNVFESPHPPRPDAETEGEIIYIHPKGRFFTVRMKFERGSYCESFACNGREGEFEEYREIKKGK